MISKIKKIPLTILGLVLAISFIGLIMLYSAAKGNCEPWAIKQATYIVIFFPIMLLIAVTDTKIWYRLSYLAYLVVLFLLLMMEIFGHTAMGATRWIDFGLIKLQPSELMKICLIFALARYFHVTSYKKITDVKYIIIPILMVLIPFVLILKQPDLGTAMILLMSAGVVFFVAGVLLKKFLFILLFCLASMPFAWHLLHDYQKKRIMIFLNPEQDPLGAGYNIIQSKIAIGSAGLWGKGLLHGSQSQLEFLPEHHTDFIFTMMAEELGFLCCLFVLMLYALLIIFGIYISMNSRNQYGRILAIGITSIFFLHVFINIAMVLGLVPVVGVPLPLLSYGGTMVMTMLIGFGLIMNVHIHSNVNIGVNDKTFF